MGNFDAVIAKFTFQVMMALVSVTDVSCKGFFRLQTTIYFRQLLNIQMAANRKVALELKVQSITKQSISLLFKIS